MTSDALLFPPAVLSESVTSSFPEGYTLRPVKKSDYHHGFLDVLRVLTAVGDISEQAWNERYEWIEARGGENGEYFIVVIEELATKKVVGVGSLILEKKFLRNCGIVGHIEDIAVAKEMQGKQFGLKILKSLDNIAEQKGCYKVILDCSEHNEGFYVKCGYKKVGIQMAHYFIDSSKSNPKVEAN